MGKTTAGIWFDQKTNKQTNKKQQQQQQYKDGDMAITQYRNNLFYTQSQIYFRFALHCYYRIIDCQCWYLCVVFLTYKDVVVDQSYVICEGIWYLN